MSKIKSVLIIIAIYLALGGLLSLFIIHYNEDLGRKKAIESQNRAVATVTSLDPHILEGLYDTVYDVIYEYYDENGTHYSGIIVLRTSDIDYAKSFIGTDVEIYIDGNGSCIRVSEIDNFNVEYYKNWCIIIGAIIAAYTVVWIALVIRSNISCVPKIIDKQKKRKNKIKIGRTTSWKN